VYATASRPVGKPPGPEVLPARLRRRRRRRWSRIMWVQIATLAAVTLLLRSS
jgi:hypothetical protein